MPSVCPTCIDFKALWLTAALSCLFLRCGLCEQASCASTGEAAPVDEEGVALLQSRSPLSTPPTPQRFTIESPNPNVLKWHDKKPLTVQGEMRVLLTGALTVHLDPSDKESPTLELEVMALLSTQQPAPHGPLLLHCGGPGSGATCGVGQGETFGKDYDSLGITQRGMGKNVPALLCDSNKSSRLPDSCPESGCQISDFTDCDCALPDGTPQIGEIWSDIDPANRSQVEALLEKMGQWGPKCLASKRFQLVGKNGKHYNFLQYVGTQYLAYDIDTLREAIGSERMSLVGWSYGTYVGGVYMTVFPDRIFRAWLDGNMSPMPQKTDQAIGDGKANDKGIAELLNNCGRFPDNCSLDDPEEDYAMVLHLARGGQLTALTKSGKGLSFVCGHAFGLVAREVQ